MNVSSLLPKPPWFSLWVDISLNPFEFFVPRMPRFHAFGFFFSDPCVFDLELSDLHRPSCLLRSFLRTPHAWTHAAGQAVHNYAEECMFVAREAYD